MSMALVTLVKQGPCPNCEAMFERTFRKNQPQVFCTRRCASQWNAKNRPRRSLTTKGYVSLFMPEHPAASKQGRVMEHRVVMEKQLARLLRADEVVHHRNGIKDDNRPENLEVMPKRIHDRRPKKPPRVHTCPECGEKIGLRGGKYGAAGVSVVSLRVPV